MAQTRHALETKTCFPLIPTAIMWKLYYGDICSLFSSIKLHNKYYIQHIKAKTLNFFNGVCKLNWFCTSVWTGTGTFYFEEPVNKYFRLFRSGGLCHNHPVHVVLTQKQSWAKCKPMGVTLFKTSYLQNKLCMGHHW